MNSDKNLLNRLKRGLLLGIVCAGVTFVILFIFRNNLSIGAVVAALAVILMYLILGRLF